MFSFVLMMKTKFRKLESSENEAVATEQSGQWRGAGRHWTSQGGCGYESGALEKPGGCLSKAECSEMEGKLTRLLSKGNSRAIRLKQTKMIKMIIPLQ